MSMDAAGIIPDCVSSNLALRGMIVLASFTWTGAVKKANRCCGLGALGAVLQTHLEARRQGKPGVEIERRSHLKAYVHPCTLRHRAAREKKVSNTPHSRCLPATFTGHSDFPARRCLRPGSASMCLMSTKAIGSAPVGNAMPDSHPASPCRPAATHLHLHVHAVEARRGAQHAAHGHALHAQRGAQNHAGGLEGQR